MIMSNQAYNRALIFAGAAPHDIASIALDMTEDGALVCRWIGTVYDAPVATAHGIAFAQRAEATHNELRFVRECKRIVQARQHTPPP